VPVAAGAAMFRVVKVFAPVIDPPPLRLTVLYVYPPPRKLAALIVDVPAETVCPEVALKTVPMFKVELPKVNVLEECSKELVVVTVLFAVVKLDPTNTVFEVKEPDN
jgi:hypothetical protein